jgi:hypothetical protein
MKTRFKLLAIAGTAMAVLLAVCFVLPRCHPMFHVWSKWGDDGVGLWSPVLPLLDRKGNYAFADPELNMLVIVSTGDSEDPKHIIPSPIGISKARLLPDTPYEVVVEAKRNVIVLLCGGGHYLEIGIGHGQAMAWFDELHMQRRTGAFNLLEEIKKRCPPDATGDLSMYLSDNNLMQETEGKNDR